jgi:tetratricopeptide (TPR) repeat protein
LISRLFLIVFLLFGAGLGAPSQQTDTQDLEKYSDEAREAMGARDWARAAAALEHLKALSPNSAEVHANLGLAYYSSNRVGAAAQEFEKALELKPDMERVPLMLALCDAELGRMQPAVKVIEAEWKRPTNLQLRRVVGLDLLRVYSGLGQYSQAAELGEHLVSEFPNDAQILYEVSHLHADRSYQLMNRLRTAAPDSYWYHFAMGQVHESMQHFDLAIEEYRKATQLDGTLPEVHYRLGRAILASSKGDRAVAEAEGEFRRELTISPDHPDAHFELGEIARERGQMEQAAKELSVAVRLNPQFFEAQIALGRTLLKQGKTRDAIGPLEKAVGLDPENSTPHFLLANAFRSLGDSARASAEFTKVQQLRGAHGSADKDEPSPN